MPATAGREHGRNCVFLPLFRDRGGKGRGEESVSKVARSLEDAPFCTHPQHEVGTSRCDVRPQSVTSNPATTDGPSASRHKTLSGKRNSLTSATASRFLFLPGTFSTNRRSFQSARGLAQSKSFAAKQKAR